MGDGLRGTGARRGHGEGAVRSDGDQQRLAGFDVERVPETDHLDDDRNGLR